MCLYAVKSFLHHSGKAFSVVLHDDGSLTSKDIASLRRHLVGVNIIKKVTADNAIARMIYQYSYVHGYRYGTFVKSEVGRKISIFALKLIDFSLFSNAAKILVLDTDVLFFKRPDEIVQWIEATANKDCLYSYEEYHLKKDSMGALDFQKKIGPQCGFNSGLICLDRSAFSLPILDDWLKINKERIDKEYILEQLAYNHLVSQTGRQNPLPSSYSFNYNDAGCVATHFGNKRLFFRNLPRVHQALRLRSR